MIAPRVVIAGLSGGGGKTLVAAGIAAAWRRKGCAVAPFKKGPDYIDAAWLSRAGSMPCRNLDLFLMSGEVVVSAFAGAAMRADISVIEGNRGLFDGVDARGSYSTAELAKLLDAPVVLVVDGTKSTRTAAALVLGCQLLDPLVPIRGVILNRTGGTRHQAVLREAIEDVCQVPVLGSLPKLDGHPFPERHLGLVPPDEHGSLDEAVAQAARIAEEHLDLERLWHVARLAPPLDVPAPMAVVEGGEAPEGARIGVFRDAAFQFYYPDNLDALKRAGAELVSISPLRDHELPEVDALYLGGGFPETLAGELEANATFRASLRRAVEHDLPVYAECGGAVYLGDELVYQGRRYEMAGALPAAFAFAERPRGHGYAVLEACEGNPFYEAGTTVRGHEFHHTYLRRLTREPVGFAFRVTRGYGFGGGKDGLRHRGVLACYTHVHALGTPEWAPSLVRAGARHRASLALAPGVGA
jgi:cobyrinic acid a,c-diamide synthase